MPRHSERIHDHAGHEVVFFVDELDDTITFDLNRFLSDSARQRNAYDPDLAQYAVLRRAISGLKVDRKPYSLTPGKKAPPRIKDRTTGLTILETLLGYVIKYNPFLIEDEDYREAFEDYVLPGQPIPEEDPTDYPAE